MREHSVHQRQAARGEIGEITLRGPRMQRLPREARLNRRRDLNLPNQRHDQDEARARGISPSLGEASCTTRSLYVGPFVEAAVYSWHGPSLRGSIPHRLLYRSEWAEAFHMQ